MRVIHELANTYNVNIFLGSTHIISPNEFLIDLINIS